VRGRQPARHSNSGHFRPTWGTNLIFWFEEQTTIRCILPCELYGRLSLTGAVEMDHFVCRTEKHLREYGSGHDRGM
jgi:hypothetical protein